MAAMRQVVDGPGGQRYVVTADRVGAGAPLARLLTAARVLPDRGDAPDPPPDTWQVRVESAGRRRVFAAANGEIAERLMVLLGEEVELGLLEL